MEMGEQLYAALEDVWSGAQQRNNYEVKDFSFIFFCCSDVLKYFRFELIVSCKR